MESGSTSYCVYTPGNTSPSRPPLRRAAPEHARSGFPFLIGMAALVLAVGVGSVARFCPQDLRFESGGRHPAKPTTAATTVTTAAPVVTSDPAGAAAPSAPTIAVIAPAAPTNPGPTAKKRAPHARSGLPTTRGATTASPHASASAAASSAPSLPENPYPQASPPETYGF